MKYLLFLNIIFVYKTINAQLCNINKCGPHGECQLINSNEKCFCNIGYIGTFCQIKDPCESKPCGSNGACFPVIINQYNTEKVFSHCQCYPGYTGATCNLSN